MSEYAGLLGTGMRIGEALALEWADLDVDAATGQVFVAGLHRQSMTKTGAVRTIALPCVAVEMPNRRRAASREHERQPVFAHAGEG